MLSAKDCPMKSILLNDSRFEVVVLLKSYEYEYEFGHPKQKS